MADAAPVLYGKYQLLDLLARGGMAEVFKAKSHGVEGFEKVLVIKRILPELSRNPQFVEMFINEAKIAVSLSHANIVQVFDLGKADDTYFIAMEYVAGYDLATILRRGRRFGRPLPPELVVFVASELAKGLDYAHRRRDANMKPLNIVHRDVSPQNVLISFEGEVKLTDFGIAKARTIVRDETEAGVLKGKYAYMAPEQATGAPVDARTDLYALGVVLYESLAGKNPFEHDSAYETIRRVREGDVRRLHKAVSELSPELADIVERAMARDPAQRHANAGRLYEELVQFLYSSGRRVGGHDLASYVADLREVSEAGRGSSEAARLRAEFATDNASSYTPEATPVEVPFGRPARPSGTPASAASGSASSSESGGRRASTGVSRPTAERRDVSVLVVLSPAGEPIPSHRLDRLVRRYAGTVLSDERGEAALGEREVAVVFGLRDPDGRDTESAARCALRLVRASSGTEVGAPPASLRVGLHSGRILVSLDGDPVRDEVFDRMRDASRALANRAAASQIVISPTAQRSIAGLFTTAPASDADDAPYVLEDERSLQDASGRFVGRRDELRQMGEILALANRGKMKMLGLSGDAGVGKTRLLLETRRRLRLGGHDVGVYVATCGRQSRGSPLAGVLEMLRAILGIEEFDPEAEIQEKISRLRELGLAMPDVAIVSAALGMAPMPEGGESLNRSLRPVVGRISIKLAQDRLTVFAFDGAESMDDESMMLLDGLLRDARDARIALVLACRPGFVHAWNDLPGYRELEVGPMTDEDVAKLTATRLGAEEVPLELLREVTAKSRGNPLYVEEYLKAIADAGALEVTGGRVAYRPEVAEVEVPKTLRGIVSTRLSRLGLLDRHLLQIAAVAGQRWTSDLLADISGEEHARVVDALTVLEGRGLVARAAEGGGDYMIAHDLVGEVLREGLTFDGRREMHRAVAIAMERLYPQRLEELAERLATHWREAGDRPRAIEYLVRAGERFAADHATAAAVASFERAIELSSQTAAPDHDLVLRLHRRIGEVCWRGRSLAVGIARLVPGVELAESLGRDDWVARLSLLTGRLMVASYRVQEGRRWLDRAGDIARKLDDRVLFRDIVIATAEAHNRIGDHRSSIQHFEQARAMAAEDGDADAQVRCLVPLALALATAGDRQAGLDALEQARALAGDKPDPFTQCELHKMESLVLYYLRDYAGSIETAERGLELAKEYGFPYEAAVDAHNMGDAYLRLADHKRAFASLRYSYEIARDNGYEPLMFQNMCILGFIDATRFGSEEGRRHVVEANEYARQHGLVWVLIQGQYYLAIVDQQRGDIDAAVVALRECLRLAADHGHVDYVEACEGALAAVDAGEPIQLPA